MARLYVLLFLAQVVLAAGALISCLSAEDGQVKALPRLVWVFVILFFPIVGSIAWFVAGRERPTGPAGSASGGSAAPARRPLAPDDDPDFLASLDKRSRDDDQERLRRWEEDLRRREEELRRPDDRDRPEV
ncbi:PLD nuclease N-terminal domain-containing protein [Micromonospora sp. WMMD1128]|uniref:PLD nuclease N-terminal domain-containing protein n=1 Tax=unclassified Micromonospora TaxID=2617518 RepID=UPI00248B0D31|nr:MULTISPECIES: PLD nuclease N-terminal domain-containing protein [unclassified Micromonospora]WBB72432.1 PLD nuclease N-terminal domain-containing protein [Micromonospora sp. WMMD1128]WFE34103.1 PLD nuclease N-terminal domain-containing protein [Micromonospora sp. WMMD975]